MRDYCKAIVLAAQQGYSADLESGTIYGPSGRALAVKIYGKQMYPTIRLHVSGLPRPAYSVHAHKFIGYLIWGEKALAGRRAHIRHLNKPTTNIRRDNLEFGDPSQNELDKPQETRARVAKNARAAQGKIPMNAILADQIDALKGELAAAPRSETGRLVRGIAKALAEKYSVSVSTISLVGKGKIWNQTS